MSDYPASTESDLRPDTPVSTPTDPRRTSSVIGRTLSPAGSVGAYTPRFVRDGHPFPCDNPSQRPEAFYPLRASSRISSRIWHSIGNATVRSTAKVWLAGLREARLLSSSLSTFITKWNRSIGMLSPVELNSKDSALTNSLAYKGPLA